MISCRSNFAISGWSGRYLVIGPIVLVHPFLFRLESTKDRTLLYGSILSRGAGLGSHLGNIYNDTKVGIILQGKKKHYNIRQIMRALVMRRDKSTFGACPIACMGSLNETDVQTAIYEYSTCLLYTSPSPRDS